MAKNIPFKKANRDNAQPFIDTLPAKGMYSFSPLEGIALALTGRNADVEEQVTAYGLLGDENLISYPDFLILEREKGQDIRGIQDLKPRYTGEGPRGGVRVQEHFTATHGGETLQAAILSSLVLQNGAPSSSGLYLMISHDDGLKETVVFSAGPETDRRFQTGYALGEDFGRVKGVQDFNFKSDINGTPGLKSPMPSSLDQEYGYDRSLSSRRMPPGQSEHQSIGVSRF